MAVLLPSATPAVQIAYIYGDVAEDGTIPSRSAPAFHQMLLTDTGNRGCSQFKAMVESEGYTIAQHYDRATTLDAAFLAPLDMIVFGLHQKLWSVAEQDALDVWIQAGGGILMYSDSAAGGHYAQVGIKNPVGQTAVNSILTGYGMQVAVDQGGGTRAYTSGTNACNPIVWDQPEFEGEGVSPVAVDESTGAEALIPFEDAYKISGSSIGVDARNVTIPYSRWAVIGHRQVGLGHVIAIFDRQPVWNNGEGSSIQRRDNREILRRTVKFLARDYGNSEAWLDVRAAAQVNPADAKRYLELTYRQWSGGSGAVGIDYTAHHRRFSVLHSPDLVAPAWASGPGIVEPVGSPVDHGDETETVTVRVLPANEEVPAGFARLRLSCALPGQDGTPVVHAGNEVWVGATGAAWLNGSVQGPTDSITWSRHEGTGNVTFANGGQPETTATFDAAGVYRLRLTAVNGTHVASDIVDVHVYPATDVVRAINCGGGAYAGQNGFSYEADTLFTGGHTDTFPGNAVARTGDDLLYNYARSNHSAYTIPVANGDYRVFLQFSETYWTGAGQRVFDTYIEGALVIDDLDLVAEAPGRWVAYDRAFPATVADGQLDLSFTASENNALLNAIVVVSDNASLLR